MNHQQIVDAGIAAIGGGTVIENAERWEPKKLGGDAQRFITALVNIRRDSQNLIYETRVSPLGEPTKIDQAGALKLATHILTEASVAYRLLRKAIGDPMFPASETDNPEWPGEPNEM